MARADLKMASFGDDTVSLGSLLAVGHIYISLLIPITSPGVYFRRPRLWQDTVLLPQSPSLTV